MMPRLDGLGLLAALRARPAHRRRPGACCSPPAPAQEAAVDGLAAGADDYLVKPFSARELLARVRTTVRLARLRTQHSRWRAAMIDSLQEGFFVGDADGRIVEMNTACTELLGFGPEGLPYAPPFPWAPGPDDDPVAHRQVADALRPGRGTEPSGASCCRCGTATATGYGPRSPTTSCTTTRAAAGSSARSGTSPPSATASSGRTRSRR